MVSDTLQGHLSEYGNDACNAATDSRQIPRIAKLVDALGSHIRTGVQFSPSPKAEKLKLFCFFFILFADFLNDFNDLNE